MNKLLKMNPVLGTLIFGTVIMYWLMLGNVSPVVIERWNIYISTKTVFATLLLLMFLCPVFLFYTIPKSKLNAYELFINSALPVLLHYILRMIDYNLVIVVLTLLMIISLSLGVYYLQKFGGIKQIYVTYYVRHIAAICVAFCIIPGYIHYRYMQPIKEYTSSYEQKDQTADSREQEREALIQELHAVNWNQLAVNEKSQLLHKVILLESKELGMKPPKLEVVNLDTDKYLGLYNHHKKAITLNTYHLGRKDITESLNTTLHECYHAYQHSVMDIMQHMDKEIYDDNLYFQKAVEWIQARDSYNDDSKTQKDYMTNALEVDARDYAEKMTLSKYGFAQ